MYLNVSTQEMFDVNRLRQRITFVGDSGEDVNFGTVDKYNNELV